MDDEADSLVQRRPAPQRSQAFHGGGVSGEFSIRKRSRPVGRRNRGGFTMRPKIISAFLAILALAPVGTMLPATVPVAAADDQVVRVDGLVQWIGGGQMVVQADNGSSVGVDLTSVPQDEYAGLGVRDRVAVIGMVSPDGRKVIGTAIMRSARGR